MIAVITISAPRELALRGHNQTIGSVRNADYMHIMKLLSQFDQFLCEHIKKDYNAAKEIP
jgi:hypothetical protein